MSHWKDPKEYAHSFCSKLGIILLSSLFLWMRARAIGELHIDRLDGLYRESKRSEKRFLCGDNGKRGYKREQVKYDSLLDAL